MGFDWDEENLAHIAKHGVSRQEAEEALNSDPMDVAEQEHEQEVRMMQMGITKQMRVLIIITTWREDILRVVTAYDAPPSMREFSLQTGENTMADKEIIRPKFSTEKEEADWWFNNQEYVFEQFKRAKAEGRLGHGTAMRQMAERQAAKSTTIRLDANDLSLAKAQAEKKGLRYQTYLKMLIHEALGQEEARSHR